MKALKHITGQYRYVMYLLALPVFVVVWVVLKQQLDLYITSSINSSSFFYPFFLFSQIPWSNLVLGLAIPMIAVVTTIFHLRKGKTRRRIQALLIILALLIVAFSWSGSFMAAFGVGDYEPIASVQIKDHIYQVLVVHGGYWGKCDPSCYPNDLIMLTCDSAMIVCEKTGFVGYEDYDAHRMFCTGVCPEPKVSLQFDETSYEITIIVNGREIKTFSLET